MLLVMCACSLYLSCHINLWDQRWWNSKRDEPAIRCQTSNRKQLATSVSTFQSLLSQISVRWLSIDNHWAMPDSFASVQTSNQIFCLTWTDLRSCISPSILFLVGLLFMHASCGYRYALCALKSLRHWVLWPLPFNNVKWKISSQSPHWNWKGFKLCFWVHR